MAKLWPFDQWLRVSIRNGVGVVVLVTLSMYWDSSCPPESTVCGETATALKVRLHLYHQGGTQRVVPRRC